MIKTSIVSGLTAKVQEIVPVEGIFVELVNLHENVSVNVFSQRSFPTGLVGN